MEETRTEKLAMYLALASTIIPGMIASNLMPAWNVLPFGGWLAIAACGSGLAGFIATPRRVRGAIAGAVAGGGALLGMWLYVLLRVGLTGITTVLSFELLIGVFVGAVPGVALYLLWAKKAVVAPEDAITMGSDDSIRCPQCGKRYVGLVGQCPMCSASK